MMQHRPNGQYTAGYLPSYIIIKGVIHFIFIWRCTVFAITEDFHRFVYYFVTAFLLIFIALYCITVSCSHEVS